MDNVEEVLKALEDFSKLKPKDIPKELDEYLGYVAKTGDPVYQWTLVKHLFHEKLSNVIKEFYETSPTIDFPPCPNVDPFNYERLKTSLLERLSLFSSAPFTVQRICELLTNPRKQYNRVDKFMRAVEKNIIVVSTREPGTVKRLENDETETVLNGIPDRLNEPNDRVINVCSDNLQFSKSEDNSQMPVVLHACVVQEEVEVTNSAPTAATTVITSETKSWCEDNETEMDTDLEIKTDLSDNPEIYVVSTTSSVLLSNNELPTTKSTNILFTETSETKSESVDNVKTASDNIHSNESIGTSTPDSPDSPDPSSSEDLCTIDNLTDEPMQQQTNETEDTASINEDSCEPVNTIETKEKENVDVVNNPVEVTEQNLLVDESSNAELSQIPEVETKTLNDKSDTADDLKPEALSPEQNHPDSSNDSCQSSSVDSKESSNNVEGESNLQNDEDLTVNSEITSEDNVSNDTEVPAADASSSPSEEEKLSDDVIIKEIDEETITGEVETEDSEKIEEIKSAVVTEVEFVSNVTSEETVASVSDCVSVEEVTEVKEQTEDVSTSEPSEVVESSKEILAEIGEEQESRTEGSIIHATPNISVSSESEKLNTITPVEDICVDQTSCSTEDEAMDVDETSNQQMITSEGETEGEPMDQSDVQSHS